MCGRENREKGQEHAYVKAHGLIQHVNDKGVKRLLTSIYGCSERSLGKRGLFQLHAEYGRGVTDRQNLKAAPLMALV